MEIDLLRQGVDLLDFYRGTLSARRLWLLIRHLPVDSAFMRKADPSVAHFNWSPDGHILADLIDITIALQTRKAQEAYPRPADRIKRHREQQDRFEALEAQAARNRQREIEAGG